MKKFSFFSLFFLRECNRNVTRSHKKTSACLCVKAPRKDIFKKTKKENDEMNLITTQAKKSNNFEFYIQKYRKG